jgi:hypothetical protein
MIQPKTRVAARRDPDDISGFSYQPVVKAVKVTVGATGADKELLRVDAGTYVRCAARIETVLNGTSPTVDIGTASDPDALIANSALDAETVDDVAESVGGILFAADGIVTIDIGGTSVTQGVVEVVFELYNFDDMMGDPHNEVTIS